MKSGKPPTTCSPTDAEAWLELSFNVVAWLRPLLMVLGTVAVPAILLVASKVNIERTMGLEFADAKMEEAFHRQRAKDINREGRLYLKLTPLCAVVYLYVGQYAMFFLTLMVMPFFLFEVPLWAWKAVGKYPGTVVQVVSWLYLFDADAPSFRIMSASIVLVMASYSFGRLCFVSWSGYAHQARDRAREAPPSVSHVMCFNILYITDVFAIALLYKVVLVFACQVDFASRLGGAEGKTVGAVFLVVNVWLLMHQYIMLQDRRESFARLHTNVELGHDLSLYTKAIDVMAKGVAISHRGGAILHVNQTWCDITGYAKESVVGKMDCPVRLLAGPNTDDLALQAIDRAMDLGEQFKCEILAYKQNGNAFWNEFTVCPVKNADGVIEQFISTIDDVTQKVMQARTIVKQKQFISTQARKNADSAAGAAKSLVQARSVIAVQAAENAELTEMIAQMRAQMIRIHPVTGRRY